jgi:hypothetical protein
MYEIWQLITANNCKQKYSSLPIIQDKQDMNLPAWSETPDNQ